MTTRSAIVTAVLLVFATSAWSADKPAPKKPAKAVKHSAKPAHQTVVKAQARKKPHATIVKTSLKPHAPRPTSAVLHGPREVLACRNGTEDRHARIAVVLVGGKTESFAYYSKWKPRTCSIYLQRNRDASRWSDVGNVTNVSTDRGTFTIEHLKGDYRFVFRDVDRERYCGMDGSINGTLTLHRGSQRCDLAGIMEEGVPLGQAASVYADAAASAPAAPAPEPPPAPVKAAAATSSAAPKTETSFLQRFAQRLHHEPSPTWRGGVIVGD